MIIPHRTTHPDFYNTRNLDLLPMPTIEDMMGLGIAVDVDYCKSMKVEMLDTMADLERRVYRRVPKGALDKLLGREGEEEDEGEGGGEEDNPDKPIRDFKITSPEQVAWFLFEVLGLGKGKSLKTTPDGSRLSTGKKQLELLKKEHDVVQDILDFREVHKLKTTYIDKFPRIVKFHPGGRVVCQICGRRHKHPTYRLHTEIVSTRTETGRLAGRRPNLMNIPARSDLGKKVRKAFVASPGKKLISCDLSQIELRVLADLANEQFMIQCFRDGRDLHAETALAVMDMMDTVGYDPKSEKLFAKVPGAALPDFDFFKDMRTGSKTANFGIVYGVTPIGLQAALLILKKPIYWTLDECEHFIEVKWHGVFKGVRPFMHRQELLARIYGFVWDLWGSIRFIPGIRSRVEKVIAEAVRQAGNMPIQSSASAFLKIIMWLVRRVYDVIRSEGYEIDPLLPIHDELLSEADEDIAYDAMHMILKVMRSVNDLAQLCVDIKADGKVYSRWEK